VFSDRISHIGLIITLAVPLMVLVIAVVKSSAVWRRYLAGRPPWQKAAAVMGMIVAVIIGGDKPGPAIPAEIIEILTVRGDGTLRDLSGRVAPGIQAKAISDYIGASGELVAAADAAIEQARLDCITLTNQLLTADYSAAYIALDLPRGTPVDTNHNIMISFERVEQTPTNMTAYIWFSEQPATNVTVHVEYSLAAGSWAALSSITNSYPITYDIGGVDCYRYCYAIPAGISGTPLRPNYEIEFGGFAPGQYLSVPEEGVVVEVDEIEYLPYTGWDDYSTGSDTLLVRYVGGIAVEAVYNGTQIKGGPDT